jgi:hypothetical protein
MLINVLKGLKQVQSQAQNIVQGSCFPTQPQLGPLQGRCETQPHLTSFMICLGGGLRYFFCHISWDHAVVSFTYLPSIALMGGGS